MTKTIERKIESFEIRCYRRSLRIKWTDKVRNTEVLKIQNQILLPIVKEGKSKYLAKRMWEDEMFIEQSVVQGKIPG